MTRVVTSSTSSMRAGLQKLERHAPHHEGRGLAPGGAVDQRAVIVADQAQEIRAAALAPAQVAGVIDEAGEIGVLEVDADGQDVPPPVGIADDAAGKVGPALGAGDQAATSTMTISGGTPMRTGKIEQPSPPETIRWRLSSTMWP